MTQVAFDFSEAFLREANVAFGRRWEVQSGQPAAIRTSFGESRAQVQAIIDGFEADVAILAGSSDGDELARAGMVPRDWRQRLPHRSVPFVSPVVFVVRRGNPKRIVDWDDLLRTGVTLVMGNPDRTTTGRWTYLAAWATASRRYQGDEARVQAWMTRLMGNVSVLADSGSRASARFALDHVGDALLTWESDALAIARERTTCEPVWPSVTLVAEPVVTWLEPQGLEPRATDVARASLDFLYTGSGQELAARHFFRPIDPALRARLGERFPTIDMLTVEGSFGDWERAEAEHFSPGGTYEKTRRR